MGYIINNGIPYGGGSATFDGGGAHNAIYRGAYLGNSVTEAQYAAIADGTFRGLYIGDYWTINGINYRIAAFDYYLNTGDTDDTICTTHHVTIVPDEIMYNAIMNTTAIAQGAYQNSDMYKNGLNAAKNTIKAAFGVEHILKHRNIFANSGKTYETNASWVDTEVQLMNELNVYGTRVLSTMVHYTDSYIFTIDKTQFPLFALNPSLSSTQDKYWLRDIASEWGFCCVGRYGYTNRNGADTALGVRPCFSIIG